MPRSISWPRFGRPSPSRSPMRMRPASGAALTPGLWDWAAATLRAVRASGPYRLETSFDHVWTGFSQYRDGPETILAFQASVRDGEPSGWNSNWGERLNFPHSGSHF